jgi:ABC-type branched-subunit amino acid transport system substrate-binding protein
MKIGARRRLIAAAITVPGLLFAACGSDDNNSSSATTTAISAATTTQPTASTTGGSTASTEATGSTPSSEATGSSAAPVSSAAPKECTGDPIKFGVIYVKTASASLRSNSDVAEGAQAAAQALTESCELGQPIEVVACDTKGDPNEAAACGRTMVDEGVVAYMGSDNFGTQWFPITEAAGIPEIGGNGLDSVQTASKLWFPLAGNIHDAMSYTTIAGSALGPDKVKLITVTLDAPGTAFFADFFKAQTEAAGGQYLGNIPVPATATDMSQYAAQIVALGGNAVIPIISGDQFTGLTQQMIQQGISFKDLVYIALGSGQANCDFREQFGKDLAGLWIENNTWPVSWDTTNEGAQQFISEVTNAGFDTDGCHISEFGVQAWSAVHIMADLLKDKDTKDSKTLIDTLNSGITIDRPELGGPIDFTKNPFAGTPVLGDLRIPNKTFLVSRINDDGDPVVVVDAPVTIGEIFTYNG